MALPDRLVKLGFTLRNFNGVEAIVPPVCPISEGWFLMGSDPARDPEANISLEPQWNIWLPFYEIAKYPVTVAEYDCFVQDGGNPPDEYYRIQSAGPEYPVINISAADGEAYATWLARITDQPWRLPTEAEWEKAARGTSGQIYSWGDAFGGILTNVAVPYRISCNST